MYEAVIPGYAAQMDEWAAWQWAQTIEHMDANGYGRESEMVSLDEMIVAAELREQGIRPDSEAALYWELRAFTPEQIVAVGRMLFEFGQQRIVERDGR